MTKYSDRIPIIVDINDESGLLYKRKKLPKLDKTKYLVPEEFTVGQFIFVIRTRMKISPEVAIYMLVND
jgi:GABA(A) receptor-associated protein